VSHGQGPRTPFHKRRPAEGVGGENLDHGGPLLVGQNHLRHGARAGAPGHAPLPAHPADVVIEIGGHDEFRPRVVKGLGLRAVDDRARAERHVGQLLSGRRDELPKHVERGQRAIRKLHDADPAGMQCRQHTEAGRHIGGGEERQGLL
jgi:hypothetical protein